VTNTFERPQLPKGFDNSRASTRRSDPAGWSFADAERAGVWRAIKERRDIRRFRGDAIDEATMQRLFEAAHAAPSVGLSQPWRFVVVKSDETKAAMQALVQKERLVQAEFFPARQTQFLDLKIEGIREAPISICVCCDRGELGEEVLGRHTVHDADVYSTCLAIENLWLAARAEGIGVGWVSFYQPDDLAALLGLPEHVVPVAWLCVGYPDERPSRPGLEANGWQVRRPLEQFIFDERWGRLHRASDEHVATESSAPLRSPLPSWCSELIERVLPGDANAALDLRDEHDELVKPLGSLGVLETILERWASATGSAPREDMSAAIVVFCADHGVARHGVSLFSSKVSSQIAGAAARGETAIGVLARVQDAQLLVVDVGLAGPHPSGVLDRRVIDGSGDITEGPAMSPDEVRRAVEIGFEIATRTAEHSDVIVVGEIGIGNTTVASTLLCALTKQSPDEVCGRGTGLDAQGVEHKRDVVTSALRANSPHELDPLECLRQVGGLEFAALVGCMLGAGASKRPILLDGFATGVAALVACRLQPSVRDYLIAGHCSAEPAHHGVLRELGLEPLLDLRLRLGEASGAALALPLVRLAASLHAQMHHFDEAGVDRALAT
jgi:nicotinate-nucleotide--dimethylbenzimidazole phosphoribosyltransferase